MQHQLCGVGVWFIVPPCGPCRSTELPADEEPAADGKAAEPEMEEDGPPDDSWMLASARSAARKELTPDERVAKDEELYNAAGEGLYCLHSSFLPLRRRQLFEGG